MRIRLHYNKRGANNGLPWTLHTSKKCIPAENVIFSCPVWTENKPNKKHNPRFFLLCEGDIEETSPNNFIIKGLNK